MEFKDIDLAMAPTSVRFHRKLHGEFIKWVVYQPTTIDKDIPMQDKWYAILYWLPKVKKQIYLILLAKGYRAVEDYLYDELGIYPYYFEREYKHFIKKLKWMQKNNNANTHFGETL